MKKITFIRFFAFLMLLFSTTISYGQYTDFSLVPSLEDACDVLNQNCTTNSVTISRVYLGQDDGSTITELTGCNSGDTFTDVYMYIDISHSTKSSIYFQFDLYADDDQIGIDGLPYTGFPNQRISAGNIGDFTPGTYRVMAMPNYTCGQELVIRNLFITWQVHSTTTPGCNSQKPMCDSDLYLEDVIVTTPIIADFTALASCEGDSFEEVIFTNTSTGGSVNNTYSWDFGADASLPSGTTGEGPHTVTYSSSGSKSVSLTVTDADNISNTDTKNLNVQVDPCCVDPVPTVTNLSDCEIGVTGSATFNLTDGIIDADGGTVTYYGSQALADAGTTGALTAAGFVVTVADSPKILRTDAPRTKF